MTAATARRWPSPAEAQALALLARGMSTVEIAAALGVTRSTVESRLRSATERLAVDGRRELRAWAVAHAPMLPGG